MLIEGCVEPVPMLQYPAAALCTELWNCVGDTCRSAPASVERMPWMTWPSPAEVAKMLARLAAGTPLALAAASAVASARRTDRLWRRRSLGASRAGAGKARGAG